MSEREVMRFKASIRAVAMEEGIPAQVVLQNFMFERLLARLVTTPIRENLIVKGGVLISSLLGLSKRTTMDLDASVRDVPLEEPMLRQMLEQVFAKDVGDGVKFAITGISSIRDDDVYGGYRVKFTAAWESIVVALSADFSTGDVVTPEPAEYFLKSRFVDNVSYRVWGYTIETILAEKIQTILSRGVLNTRARDFYDVAMLVRSQMPDANSFVVALRLTCEHRQTVDVLSDARGRVERIAKSDALRELWERYRRQYSFAAPLSFDDVCDVVRNLISNL